MRTGILKMPIVEVLKDNCGLIVGKITTKEKHFRLKEKPFFGIIKRLKKRYEFFVTNFHPGGFCPDQ